MTMRVSGKAGFIAGILGCSAAMGAYGQALTPPLNLDTSRSSSPYDVKTMTFDLWCQDTQRYPTERCTMRRPDDVKAFEDYRDAVERYELDYLKQVQKDQDVRDRTNRDPLGASAERLDTTP
jgi:hypothetical protein